MARKPSPEEKVICPRAEKGAKRVPEKVYEVDGLNKKKKWVGELPKHKHRASPDEECDWSGLPVDVVREKKEEPKSS